MAIGAARILIDWTDGPAPIEIGPGTGVRVNNFDVAVEGSAIACHQHGNTTICQSPIQTGSPTVRAGGKGILRHNDQAQCGHKIITASPNVSVA